MRVVFIQNGDYRFATIRFAAGEDETCGSQRYSVDTVGDLTSTIDFVSVVSVTGERYDEPLSNKVYGVGMGWNAEGDFDQQALLDRVAALKPTHLIMRRPLGALMQWAQRQRVRLLPMLADSFTPNWKRWWRYRTLAKQLNRAHIEWVCDHNVGSCRTLERIGVRSDKIIPWDWPPERRPEDQAARQLDMTRRPYRILFVGIIKPAKGVGDVIEAVAHVRRTGIDLHATIVGPGDVGPFVDIAARVGVKDKVTFTGRLERKQVMELIREHDLAVVPSRHEYSEGMPKTINEALCARTPLILSDHPVFTRSITDGVGAVMFAGGDSSDLALKIQQVLSDPARYHQLSLDAEKAFARCECPAKWGDVIRHWIHNTDDDRTWLARHTLTSGLYADR